MIYRYVGVEILSYDEETWDVQQLQSARWGHSRTNGIYLNASLSLKIAEDHCPGEQIRPLDSSLKKFS